MSEPTPTAEPTPERSGFSFVVRSSVERRRRLVTATGIVGLVLLLIAAGIGIGAVITAGAAGPVGLHGQVPPAGSGSDGLGGGGVHPIGVFPLHGSLGPGSTTHPATPTTTPPPSGHGASTPLPPSPPTRIWIPAIGVSTSLIRLGLLPDGSLQVPSAYSIAGWWVGGPTPGEQGAAVIVGHVDSTNGPAVFYRLRQLKPGDVVWVAREDHADVEFVVQRIEEVSKLSFPTRAVYGPQPNATLRLITCGGAFDHGSGHYVDNIIVFATAAH